MMRRRTADPSVTAPSSATQRILVVEDSATQLEALRLQLEGAGFEVEIAVTGEEAIARFDPQRFDLVISDIVMPGAIDGYELCRRIKAGAGRHVPVVLLTSLADPLDIINGLECGADNFLTKPHQLQHLLDRIGLLLATQRARAESRLQVGVDVFFLGRKFTVSSEREQILDLLMSTFEDAVLQTNALRQREEQLARSHQSLHGLYRIALELNGATTEAEVAESALARALELPGVQAGWISLREGESGFRAVAARGLPAALEAPRALHGDCLCRRKLLAGELDSVTNILECERLRQAKGDTRGLRYHAAIPLRIGDRTIGIMNLAGPNEGMFSDDDLQTLYGVGNQLAVALERARLHEHLEQLVEERTAALTEEIAERKHIQEEQARLVAIIEATPDFVATGDLDDHALYINQAGLRMLGYEPGQDVSELRVGAGQPDWVLKLIREIGIPHAIEHGTWSGESAFLLPDGKEMPVLQVVIAHKRPDGSVEYLSTIARDITLRKANETRIKRLNRIYSVLSGINTMIVRVREQDELFREACRIAVEHGRFVFAWIGKLDAAIQQVTPVAQAGRDDGYLAQINLTSREDTPGNCALTAQALTEVKPVICNDIASDERMAALRSEALSRGYRSAVVLPLILEGKPAGVFVLYAPEPGVFDDEEMLLLIEVAGDISFAMDNLKKEEKLNYLAYYDVITGLPNRALFYDRLDQLLHDAQSGEMIAVLAIDLERFRVINETFGRHAGDALLKQVAERLITMEVGADHLARISADCFALVLTNIREVADVVRFLENRVATVLTKPFKLEDQELRLSARVGIAIFPVDGKDADTLFRNAEAAVKKAKLSGDKYLFYTPALNARAAEKLTLENKLRRALEQEQLVLHYQPKVDLKNNRICGLEALMRWNDPETGLVPPWKFIPLLEETGMIIEAGAWALARAMADYQDLQKKNLSPPRIAVNVSQVQLQRNDFVSMVERVVSGSGGVPGGLEIEITESLVMQDVEANILKLRAIREMGMEVAIDDFGTGYSSLSYIAKLPINALKIDRAFIINMSSSADDLSIVSAIISLAHSLSLRVIAEGVETDEQAKLLRLLKCDEIQGFLFSPGVPIAQIEEFLRDKKSL